MNGTAKCGERSGHEGSHFVNLLMNKDCWPCEFSRCSDSNQKIDQLIVKGIKIQSN